MLKIASREDLEATGSPILQALAAGGLAYFGTDYIHRKWNEPKYEAKMQELSAITDPQVRASEIAKYQEEFKKKRNKWKYGLTALASGTALAANSEHFKDAYNMEGTDMSPVARVMTAGMGGGYGVNQLKKHKDYVSSSTDYGDDMLDAVNVMKKESMEKKASDYSTPLGANFKMPYIRPLSSVYTPDIQLGSIVTSMNDPNNQMILGHDISRQLAQGAIHTQNMFKTPLASPAQLMQGLVRTGIGSVVGLGMSHVLGSIFNLPNKVQKIMNGTGAIGGAILNSGLVY